MHLEDLRGFANFHVNEFLDDLEEREKWLVVILWAGHGKKLPILHFVLDILGNNGSGAMLVTDKDRCQSCILERPEYLFCLLDS